MVIDETSNRYILTPLWWFCGYAAMPLILSTEIRILGVAYRRCTENGTSKTWTYAEKRRAVRRERARERED